MANKAKPGFRFASPILVLLFGLPFLAVGCVTGYFALRMVSDHLDARGWVEAQATIREVDLKRHRSRKSSTSYKVICSYAYTFDGRKYENDRVGLIDISDNIGAWQRNTYNRLNAAYRKGRTVPCYVNPARPAESLLDRELRFWMLFFLLIFPSLFGGVGLAVVGGSLSAMLAHTRHQQKQVATTAGKDQPWLLDPRWSSGIIHHKGASKARWAVLIAVFWNAIWLPFLIFLPAEVAKDDYWALLTITCPVIGIALAAWAVRCVLHHRKFGRSHFELRTLPGVIGGRLSGDVVLIGDLASLDRVEATLKCRQTVTEYRKGKKRTRTDTLWEQSEVLPAPAVRFGEEEARLPLSFQIPHSCCSTDDQDADGKVEWKLLVRAPAVGVDLSLEFDVPVFRTEHSDASVTESPEIMAEDDNALADENPPPLARIRRERDASGNSAFVISAWPGLSMGGVLFAFCLLLTGVTVFLAAALSRGYWFALPFVIVFGLIGLLLWVVLLSFFGSYHVTAGLAGLTVRRRFGPFTTQTTIRPAEIAGFSYKQSASNNNRQWYAVHVQHNNGRKVQLASAIQGRTGARWLIRQLEEATAREVSHVP